MIVVHLVGSQMNNVKQQLSPLLAVYCPISIQTPHDYHLFTNFVKSQSMVVL